MEMQIQLLRPIRWAGQIMAEGSKLSVSVSTGTDLVHARKAREVPAEEPAAEVAAEKPAAEVKPSTGGHKK